MSEPRTACRKLGAEAAGEEGGDAVAAPPTIEQAAIAAFLAVQAAQMVEAESGRPARERAELARRKAQEREWYIRTSRQLAKQHRLAERDAAEKEEKARLREQHDQLQRDMHRVCSGMRFLRLEDPS